MKNLDPGYKELLHINKKKADNTILGKNELILSQTGITKNNIYRNIYVKVIYIQEVKIKTKMQSPHQRVKIKKIYDTVARIRIHLKSGTLIVGIHVQPF